MWAALECTGSLLMTLEQSNQAQPFSQKWLLPILQRGLISKPLHNITKLITSLVQQSAREEVHCISYKKNKLSSLTGAVKKHPQLKPSPWIQLWMVSQSIHKHKEKNSVYYFIIDVSAIIIYSKQNHFPCPLQSMGRDSFVNNILWNYSLIKALHSTGKFKLKVLFWISSSDHML